ncbi:dihydrofolate reductase family protein [Nonomuraea zeae]|uniref:Dihydrofolate reductase n=1 Tax=Nonomuraea zeae TaxID=1642303 RepID=A0A5S4G6R2_9ACTN|nr:dihydrofolate reductase family protein [Nonomuraea zeae]TMR28708.1 dihydrofolate reductase [Nonomuraea zeae]
MRKIVAELFSSLDGVVAAPDQWHGPYHNDEIERDIQAGLAAADTMLLGRRTYQEHAGFWPTESGGPADLMNDIDKVVFSATLSEVGWRNSRLATGDLAEEVARLKSRPGRDILVTGSVTLVQTLLRAGVLDELRLLVDPVVVRDGRRLFASDGDRLSCSLVGSRTYQSGTISATYAINH